MVLFRNIGWIPIIFLLGFGCKAPKTIAAAEKGNEEVRTSEDPMIMTIIFSLTALDSLEIPRLEINDVITSGGFLKDKKTKQHQTPDEGLNFHILDIEGTILEEQYISNPLKKRYETNEDNGLLKSHEIDLNTATFSIRIQKNPRVHSLKVYFTRQSELILIKHLEL